MVNIPQQDWSLYETLSAPENAEWIRGLSPQDRFAIYEDLFNVICAAPRSPGDIERLEESRWDQKLELRLRLLDAYTRLDQLRRERAAANNTG